MKMKLTAQYFKDYLLRVYRSDKDFDVIITSKTPKTRLGYYRINNRLIVIHYIGVRNLNELHRTAIHELAHHIHYAEFDKQSNEERTHGKEFYIIFNALLTIAAQKKLYLYNDDRIETLINKKQTRNFQ